MNYVVMMHSKESEKYGQPLRVQSFSEEKVTKDKIQERIKEWADKNAVPVLIEDTFMISVFDMLYNRDQLDTEKTEAEELRSELRNVISDLQGLAY